MEEYKNSGSIREVRKVLEDFQHFYAQRDTSGVDRIIDELCSSKEGIVLLGSGMDEWCFNKIEAKELIKSHLREENNYWKEIDFKFEEAKVFANENTAWVISIGNIKNTISEDDQAEETIKVVKELLCKESKSQENALNAAFKIAAALNEIDKGSTYLWPFRFASVLVKEDSGWKFHHMQFSLDSKYFWQHRFLNENYDKQLFEIPVSNSNKDIEEVKKVLQIFQDGYTRRDLSYVDEYMKEVFVLDEEQVVIGTDADELCIGPENIRGIIESDWKYWGDLKVNVNEAMISVFEDVAWFTTKAIIKRTTPKEKMLEWIGSSADYIFKTDKKPKDKLKETLCDINMFLYESERGEIFIAPMRLSGVLVKVEGKWKLHHVQYSDYIDGVPQARV
jgi:hypothetical protein